MAESQKSEVSGRKPEAGSQKPEASEQIGEDAEVATKTDESLAPETMSAPPAPDEDGFVWPEGSEPSAGAGEQNATAPEPANAPLPALDELVKRIPPEVRETLDDLFRARFVTVKRAEPGSLKS